MPLPPKSDDVTFMREEVSEMLPRYAMVRDCVEQRVKDKGVLYLPAPNVDDVSAENSARYAAYLDRAVFYAVTGRTLSAMVGQIFSREPEAVFPPALQSFVDNATGSGISLHQVVKDACDATLRYGRKGVLTDFPRRTSPATLADMAAGRAKPQIAEYGPEAIINWRYRVIDKVRRLVLVVLAETVEDDSAEFALTKQNRWRVLRLRENFNGEPLVYTQTVYGEVAASSVDGSKIISPIEAEYVPLDGAGKVFDEIQFDFIGALNNDADVDPSPLYDMATLNIGHYRNSADYEEATFITGQPTLWMTGLDADWVEDVFKGEPIFLGSRRSIPLPVGAMCGLLQVSPNSMPMEAMRHKESQMVAMGARLVENRQVRRTAFETGTTQIVETSVLATIAENVSKAYTSVLRRAARFINASGDASYTLNTDFAMSRMSIEERSALIADYAAGLVGFAEARDVLRRGGVATADDAAVKAEADARAAAAAAAKTAPAAGNGEQQ